MQYTYDKDEMMLDKTCCLIKQTSEGKTPVFETKTIATHSPDDVIESQAPSVRGICTL